MAYVSVMLIGSVVIDNQSILTLLEAWLTVARDLLYYTEQFTINARYQPVSGKSEPIILKKTGLVFLKIS